MATGRRRSVGSQIRLAAAIVALVLLIVFVALNFAEVEVELLIAQVNLPLAFALISTGLLGFVVGYFAPKGHRD